MKKIVGVVAILLSMVLFVLYRQLVRRPVRAGEPRISVPAIMQENLMLTAALFQ